MIDRLHQRKIVVSDDHMEIHVTLWLESFNTWKPHR
jgi:hypothetical protein